MECADARSYNCRSFEDDIVEIMEQKLTQFDKARIDRGLKIAYDIIEANGGSMNMPGLAQHDDSAILGLFEALCCMPYVAEPDNRQRYFNKVFYVSRIISPYLQYNDC